MQSGKAELHKNGKLEVKVKGLVLNDASTGDSNGTPDGVDAVAAAVICSGPNGAAVAAQTETVPLSKTGDGGIAELNSTTPYHIPISRKRLSELRALLKARC